MYFAHPYSSCERSKNERHNRLFRSYVSKRCSIEQYDAEEIIDIANAINDKPRCLLEYMTASELFEDFLDKVYALEGTPCKVQIAR